VTEVGRQPWIVRNYMKVEQAATSNQGVWIMFLLVLVIYATVGVTLILILRKMSARFRADGVDIDAGGPYGPPEPIAAATVPADHKVTVQ
jgi:cytochrome d ubiquinol oxidase subunit I